jgi:hypothetical protein
MAILRVDDFRGKMTGGGARANLFEVNVNFPGAAGGDTELTNFMCRGAQLPEAVTGVVEVPFRGRMIKFPGDRTFNNWTMTIYNDTNFTIRNSFERWFNAMNTHLGNIGLIMDNAGYGTYLADIEVNQLNQAGGTVKKYKIRNAFPANIGAIDLDYNQATDIEQFTVEMAFDYWTSSTTS